MAIQSIQNSPYVYTHAWGPIIWSYVPDPVYAAACGYKGVFDVFVTKPGATGGPQGNSYFAGRIKQPPNPSGTVIVDVAPLIQPFIDVTSSVNHEVASAQNPIPGDPMATYAFGITGGITQYTQTTPISMLYDEMATVQVYLGEEFGYALSPTGAGVPVSCGASNFTAVGLFNSAGGSSYAPLSGTFSLSPSITNTTPFTKILPAASTIVGLTANGRTYEWVHPIPAAANSADTYYMYNTGASASMGGTSGIVSPAQNQYSFFGAYTMPGYGATGTSQSGGDFTTQLGQFLSRDKTTRYVTNQDHATLTYINYNPAIQDSTYDGNYWYPGWVVINYYDSNGTSLGLTEFMNAGASYSVTGTGVGFQINVLSIGFGGSINTSNIAVAGTGYAIGDLFYVNGGTSPAIGKVTGINGTGGVTSYTFTFSLGSGYTAFTTRSTYTKAIMIGAGGMNSAMVAGPVPYSRDYSYLSSVLCGPADLQRVATSSSGTPINWAQVSYYTVQIFGWNTTGSQTNTLNLQKINPPYVNTPSTLASYVSVNRPLSQLITFKMLNPGEINPSSTDYKPIRLSWLNDLGGRDYFTFNKYFDESYTSESQTYYRDPNNWADDSWSISPWKGGTRVYNRDTVRTVKVVSDWVTEDYVVFLRSLYESPSVHVWLPYNAEFPYRSGSSSIPVQNGQFPWPGRVVNNSWRVVQQLAAVDKMVQVTMEIEISVPERVQQS